MLEIGKMINKKDMVKKNGKMEHFIKVVINQVKNKEKGYLFGETIAHLKENLKKIIFMGKGNMYGKMEESMKENGSIIKCMEKAFLLGLMEGNMMDNIAMIKSMVLEYLYLKTEEFMKENGKVESNTEEENIKRRNLSEKEYGKME